MAERKTKKQGSETGDAQDSPKEQEGARVMAAQDSGSEDSGSEGSGAQSRAAVSGPGTGKAAPADDKQRTPSTTVLATEAGPLVPTDVQKVEKPALGHLDSSSDTVSAHAAQQSVPGTTHLRVADMDDNDVDIDNIFTTKDPADPSVYVYATQDVVQVYRSPGARSESRKLLYRKGARVTVFEAERVKAALREGEQDPAESMRPQP